MIEKVRDCLYITDSHSRHILSSYIHQKISLTDKRDLLAALSFRIYKVDKLSNYTNNKMYN